MFEALTFRNFLSFGPEAAPVRLGRLNVIVGPNGSGKSNFLDGIGLLAGCTRKGALGRILMAGGGVEAWIDQASKAGPSASLESVYYRVYPIGTGPEALEFERRLRHHFELNAAEWGHFLSNELLEVKEGPHPQNPELVFGMEGGSLILAAQDGKKVIRPEAINASDSVLAQIADPTQYSKLDWLAGEYERIRLYRDWTFGRSAGIRRPGATDSTNDYLHPDASNLAMVINGLKRGVRNQIVARLQDLAPTFTGIETKVLASTIQLFLVEGDHEVSALRLSDGTLRYLAMLVMFLHPNPPPVTVLEEPELGLHPDLLPGLAKLMVEASARTQIIATTHSDIIIDALTDHIEAVLVCDKDEQGTSIQPIDAASLDHWLKEYGLGQAWLRGAIGGSRW